MKCEVCKSPVEETFLNKIVGTRMKDTKGKLHMVCAACQKKFGNDKQKILKTL